MKGRKHTQTPQVDIKAQTHTHTHTHTRTAGGAEGAGAPHGTGCDEVSDVSQCQQACWAASLDSLVLDQALQLLFKHLQRQGHSA